MSNPLEEVYNEIFGESQPSGNGAGPAPAVQPSNMDDAELLEKARGAANGDKFTCLWTGDTTGYDSQSEADQALCNLLAFWTGREATQMDRLFRESKLMRPKWDERHSSDGSTYGEITLEKAVKNTTDTYAAAEEYEFHRGGEKWQPPDAPARTLDDVLSTFREWMYLPDPGGLYVMLASYAANLLPGDPLWMLFIEPPSNGKTEKFASMVQLPRLFSVSTVTEAGFLSGVSKREKTPGASGGLLNAVGRFGVIVCKDFGSILSLRYEQRAVLLAALREIYDGEWTRHLGTDGGKTLTWQGKVGLIAGVTPAYDMHQAVMAALGERFLNYRAEMSAEDEAKQGEQALANVGRESRMRTELAVAVAGLFAGIVLPEEMPAAPEGIKKALVNLAVLTVRCRSAVIRDGYTREIELVPANEAPARLAKQLLLLWHGLRIIGLDDEEAWQLVRKVSLAGMVTLRRRVLEALSADDWQDTTTIAETVAHPTTTTRRALEDLTAHSVALRQAGGSGKADKWQLSPWAATLYQETQTFPENSLTVHTYSTQ